ncbi:pickpocket protein 28-like [Photinus pyralis]|uniref:pickpocket protein 28-like n=1 Tax=Photinus pyralis TaxID=7054 RepID=UPI0012674D48|nr:pickpocket protein 28-like [Photinus pyralis]
MSQKNVKILHEDLPILKLGSIYEAKLVKVSPLLKQSSPVKEQKSVPYKNLRNYLRQYCETTTIHGIRYIGERGRLFLERLAWTTTWIFLCAYCLTLIHKAYVKWERSPVIVTFATQETSISRIPFPAVTVCPDVKFDVEVFNFTRTLRKMVLGRKLTQQEKIHLPFASLICKDAMELGNFTANLNRTLENVASHLLEMLPEFDPLSTTTLKWMGRMLDYNDELILIPTPDGMCFTFNMLPFYQILRIKPDGDWHNYSTDLTKRTLSWSLEQGYSPGDDEHEYPRRTFVPGVNGGLTIRGIFTNDSHIDALCMESLQGFKIALHLPCEFPNMEKHFRLPLNQALLVAIKPSLITVSRELWNYPPSVRKCYFANEKYLASFLVYTQQNCLDECLANYTYSICGCTPFYFALVNESVPVCGPGRDHCVKESKLNYLKIEGNSESKEQQCECLPSCTSLSYDVETSQSEWRWKKAFDAMNISRNKMCYSAHFSTLYVYYKELLFLSCQRNELYGLLEFFSNMGGLLGLFIGFSVTSAVEILYFCTFRIMSNIKLYGIKSWSGTQDSAKTK